MRSVFDNAKDGALSVADTVVLTPGRPDERKGGSYSEKLHRETACGLLPPHDTSHVGLTYYISLLMNHHSQIFKYFINIHNISLREKKYILL